MPYSIREVDATDEDVVDDLDIMHNLCFGNSAPPIDHSAPLRWWLAYHGKEPVAFGGITPAVNHRNSGYLYRSGVMPEHRGNRLQVRLLRARERAARRIGWDLLVTDTTDNVHSSNALIAAGYHIYRPRAPWSFMTAIYWRKKLA